MKNCLWFTFTFMIGWMATPITLLGTDTKENFKENNDGVQKEVSRKEGAVPQSEVRKKRHIGQQQGVAYDYDYNNEYGAYGNGEIASMDEYLHTPEFISRPIIAWSDVGDSLRLPCIVERLESYVLIWKKDGNILTMGTQVIMKADDRIKLEEERDRGNYLVISSAEETDAGEYVCQIAAYNPIELKHSVNIRVEPVIRLTPESGLLTVKEGDFAALQCFTTAGNPSPSITWRRREGRAGRGSSPALFSRSLELYMPHSSMIPGKEISFNRVNRNHSGYYVCSAMNGVGPPVSAEIKLDVQQIASPSSSSSTTAVPATTTGGGFGEWSFLLQSSSSWLGGSRQQGSRVKECSNCFNSVDVVAPEYVTQGQDAKLECIYNLPIDRTWSTKWYKDHMEFYRYIPSDSPSSKVFKLPGVHVDLLNPAMPPKMIYLKNVDLSTTGSYKCEVSSDSPSFITKHGVKNLTVVAPRNIPQDDEKYATAVNVSELIAEKLVQYDNDTFDLYVDASKNFAKMIDIGIPEDLLKYLENPEEYKIVTKQSAISSSSSSAMAASTSTTAPPATTAGNMESGFFFGPSGGRIRAFPRYRVGLDFRFSMWIKPRNVTGLLLAVKGRRDYAILEMFNGEIIFSVDNGRGPFTVKFKPESPDYLSNGEWHKIEAFKTKNVATVAVDNIFGEAGVGAPGSDSTDTNNPLFIGGHDRPTTLRRSADTNFVGCIKDFSIDNDNFILSGLNADDLFGDVSVDCPLY